MKERSFLPRLGAFTGAVAIPDALNHYSALYAALADKLFADPEFRAALA